MDPREINPSDPYVVGDARERPPVSVARRVVRTLGLVLAAGLSLAGVALSRMISWGTNCKWGFFGETGPTLGAGTYGWDDLAGPAIGWALACVPWMVIGAATSRHPVRRLAWSVVVLATAAVALMEVPHVLDPARYWSAACT